MRKFYIQLKAFLNELMLNGKLLTSYLLMYVPELNDYPMLVTAIQDFAADPSWHKFAKLLFQVFMAGAAGSRLVKVVKASNVKAKKEYYK